MVRQPALMWGGECLEAAPRGNDSSGVVHWQAAHVRARAPRRRARTARPHDDSRRTGGRSTWSRGTTRPNQLWVSESTYVAAWRGFGYVAFVIGVFVRRIVGWRASTLMRNDLALDALEEALRDRETDATLVHYTGERPGQATPLDPLHRTRWETVKTDVIQHDGP